MRQTALKYRRQVDCVGRVRIIGLQKALSLAPPKSDREAWIRTLKLLTPQLEAGFGLENPDQARVTAWIVSNLQ